MIRTRTRLGSNDESEIAAYLLQHTDFLTRHPEVLAALEIPHSTGSAVSLVERQVQILRQDARQAERRLQQLIQVARDNDQLNNRLHQLTLALLETRNPGELVETLRREIRTQFGADAVELKLFTHVELEQASDEPGMAVFEEFIQADRPTCGQLRAEQLQSLFAGQLEATGSAALIPIRTSELLGILAIGSVDANRFHPGMAVDFLVRLSELVSLALQQSVSSAKA